MEVPITKLYPIYFERLCRPDMVTASFYFPHTLVLGNDNLNIYKVYEFLNTKIKETLIEEIRTIFTSRKIKTKINFSEVIDDEEPDE